ncbi:MAG: Omp28 family outer membrane lipoprotein [Muribaculum sp.]|nr:Omp28 family outer membrane lipoprotein [Muribaculum sp.]
MKAYQILSVILLLAGFATACDNISEDDRYIKVEKPVVDNPRTLLIMEFTGNNCKNCPNGASMVEQIKEDEGANRVISVGLHPYGDINTNPVPTIHPSRGTQDFRSDAATVLYDYYKPSGFPSAIFNGLNMSGSIPEWMQRASEALKSSSAMSIEASSSYDADSRLLSVDYHIDFGNVIDKKLNVTVWLVENHILGTQTMPDGKLNLNYEHNHVLRASLNGDWGEYIGDRFDSDSEVSKTASMTLNENWVAENCQVVIYVYADDNKEVEQAIQIPAVPASEE